MGVDLSLRIPSLRDCRSPAKAPDSMIFLTESIPRAPSNRGGADRPTERRTHSREVAPEPRPPGPISYHVPTFQVAGKSLGYAPRPHRRHEAQTDGHVLCKSGESCDRQSPQAWQLDTDCSNCNLMRPYIRGIRLGRRSGHVWTEHGGRASSKG